MPYTQSQLRCLQGMGIVPWVSRDDVAINDGAVAQLMREVETAEQSDNQIPVAAPLSTPVAMPAAASVTHLAAEPVATKQADAGSRPDSLALKLMQTRLVEIPFRGQRCAQLGKSDAPLLILVEAISTQQKQYPFEAKDAKLFDDMLRSIAWRRQDVCLAVLPPAGNSLMLEEAGDLSTDLSANKSTEHSAVPCVADVCKPHRDAVLLFRMSLPETLNTDELVVPMERKSMMAWQLPHPAMLRESPNRKRQAWNVLKAVRQRLHPIG